MSAVLPVRGADRIVVPQGTPAGSRTAPSQGLTSLGKYREIIIAVAFFLLFDLGVLVLNFYTSFKIDQDTVAINLSGRQRVVSQRVGIAPALSMEPKVLLLDEPFGALDALTRAKLPDELLQIVATTQSTVVMVTHDVDEAVLLSDRIVMMTNGPSATIGEILQVELPRPRSRVALAEDIRYLGYRKAVIDFLYTRQGHVEKAA